MLFKMLSFVPTKVWLIYIIYNVCITVYRPVLVYTCLQLTLKVEQRKLFFKNFFLLLHMIWFFYLESESMYWPPDPPTPTPLRQLSDC